MKKIKGLEDYYATEEGHIVSTKRKIPITLKESTNHRRLIAKTFLECSSENMEVNHIDGNKLNNHISNLEWVTHRENINHSFRIGLNKNIGSNHTRSKLTENQVLNIREMLSTGIAEKDIANKYNITQALVNLIKQKKRWKHI
jgi:hypothetical protein